MSYKVGDKFIIEIDRIYSSKKHDVSRYGMKGFANLILDDRALKQIEKFNSFENIAESSFDLGRDAGWHDGYTKGLEEGSSCKSELLDKFYQRGSMDAWDAAQEIFGDSDLDYDDIIYIFGQKAANDNNAFFTQYTAEEVIKKLEEWKQFGKNEIKSGDEVEAWDTNTWVRFIAWHIGADDSVEGFDEDGGMFCYPKASCRKTGKRFQIILSETEEEKLPWA